MGIKKQAAGAIMVQGVVKDLRVWGETPKVMAARYKTTAVVTQG